MLHSIIQQVIFGILISFITMHAAKYIDSLTSAIIKDKKLTKLLISIDMLIFIVVILLFLNASIYVIRLANKHIITSFIIGTRIW
ncbi:MAG: hypothetical protein ACOYVK_13575 [Bacillota bacterium]